MSLYTLILLAIFAERAYCKVFQKNAEYFLVIPTSCRLFRGTRTLRSSENCRLRCDCNERCCISDDVHVFLFAGHYVQKYDHLFKGHGRQSVLLLRFDGGYT